MAGKRERINLQTKVDILKDIDSNVKYNEIVDKYKLSNICIISSKFSVIYLNYLQILI